MIKNNQFIIKFFTLWYFVGYPTHNVYIGVYNRNTGLEEKCIYTEYV